MTPHAEDDHIVRARIAHGLEERGHVGYTADVARRVRKERCSVIGIVDGRQNRGYPSRLD
jgi:hypothetical protein